MKKSRGPALLSFALILALALPAGAMDKADWLILHYMAADNDLARNAIADINEMEAAADARPDGVRVFVLLDISRETYQDGIHDFHGAQVMEIVADTDPQRIASPRVWDLGRANTGDPTLLKDFVRRVRQRVAARHVLLSIWNHGSGWKTIPYGHARGITLPSIDPQVRCIGYDDVARDSLTLSELASALAAIHEEILRAPLDVLVFDACLMQMVEVLAAVDRHARYVIGSEEIAPDQGYDHVLLHRRLATAERLTPLSMARLHLQAYMEAYSADTHPVPAAISLVDTGRLPALDDAFAVLVRALDRPEHAAPLELIRQDVRNFQDEDYIDLQHFLRLLARSFHDGDVAAALPAVEAALQRSVRLNLSNSERFHDCGGISLYFPRGPLAQGYADLRFNLRTGWARLLQNLPSGQGGRISLPPAELRDESGDGNLSPGEKARIAFRPRNPGTETLQTSFRLEISGPATTSGEVRELTLDAGDEAGLEFSLQADGSATVGTGLGYQLYQQMNGRSFPVARGRLILRTRHAARHSLLLISQEGSAGACVERALDEAGVGYDSWQVADKGTPGDRLLEQYRGGLIIRLLPDSSDRNPFPAAEDRVLARWLKSSGRLLLSGQDFAASYGGGELFRLLSLRADSDDGGSHRLALSDGTYYTLNGDDSADNQLFLDTLTGDGCERVIDYLDEQGKPAGAAALLRRGDGWRALVLGFGLEGVAGLTARSQLIAQLLERLEVPVRESVARIDRVEDADGEARLLLLRLEEELSSGRLDAADEILAAYAGADDRTRAALEPGRDRIREYLRLRRMSDPQDPRTKKLLDMDAALDERGD